MTEDAPTPDPGELQLSCAFALEPEPPPAAGRRELGKPATAKQRREVDRHLADELQILGQLNAVRARFDAGPIRETYGSLSKIAERLESGATREECLAVVDHCEAEILAGDERGKQYLDSMSPFRAENFERKLAMVSPAQVRAGPARAGPARPLSPWRGMLPPVGACPATEDELPR